MKEWVRMNWLGLDSNQSFLVQGTGVRSVWSPVQHRTIKPSTVGPYKSDDDISVSGYMSLARCADGPPAFSGRTSGRTHYTGAVAISTAKQRAFSEAASEATGEDCR